MLQTVHGTTSSCVGRMISSAIRWPPARRPRTITDIPSTTPWSRALGSSARTVPPTSSRPRAGSMASTMPAITNGTVSAAIGSSSYTSSRRVPSRDYESVTLRRSCGGGGGRRSRGDSAARVPGEAPDASTPSSAGAGGGRACGSPRHAGGRSPESQRDRAASIAHGESRVIAGRDGDRGQEPAGGGAQRAIAGQHLGVVRLDRNDEAVERPRQALAGGFDHGFLARPAGKEGGALHGSRKDGERLSLRECEGAGGDRLPVRVLVDALDVDADVAIDCDRAEHQRGRMRHVESQSFPDRTVEPRLPTGPGHESDGVRRATHHEPEQLAKPTAADDVGVTVAISQEPTRTPALLR